MFRTKKKTRKKYIYYTGIGASKTGRHTKKQFLKIAKKHFKDCTSKKCKKIKNSKKKFIKILEKKPLHYDDFSKLLDKLDKCRKKNKCSFKEYIKYSGAEII